MTSRPRTQATVQATAQATVQATAQATVQATVQATAQALMRALVGALACAAVAAGGAVAAAAGAPAALFFDDFEHADLAALRAAGWTVRTTPGHPGVPGAAWREDAVHLLPDPERRGRPGRGLLRLAAHTDGTPAGTVQAQVCHARKVLKGTYAARVRFTDEPVAGADGDPIIQTFYAVSPLAHDFDPEFSEIDWEYLPNGGWGSPLTRLYAIAWQTVRIEPWQAHNEASELKRSFAGWHTLVMQVAEGRSRWFVDGQPVATHGGRNHPVVPMALSFNLWFSPGGLMPASAAPRRWVQDVDWVLHVVDQAWSPAQVQRQVDALRAAGRYWVDTVPAPVPPLASECRF